MGDDDDFVKEVFGDDASEPDLATQPRLKTNFSPWHHPVKQLVRELQWRDLTTKLLSKYRTAEERKTLHYLTLPGSDLLDIRLLADAVQSTGTKITYLGFDVSRRKPPKNGPSQHSGSVVVEATLRQADLVTSDAEIVPDRLEDIAVSGSKAESRLKQSAPFDVINLDACEHLAYVPAGRESSLFDALEALLKHQLDARQPWLLFVTTRVDPKLLGPPATKLQTAISENLDLNEPVFDQAVAECLGTTVDALRERIKKCWDDDDDNFLKVFSLGLGKYLLQFYHAQPNRQANVELVSAYGYQVHKDKPDMLSLAFRISPTPKVLPAAAAQKAPAPLEMERGAAVAKRAMRIWNLDNAIADNDEARRLSIDGTRALLDAASYDLVAWAEWLKTHPSRPMETAG